jgi:long-subunit fatty acid transport protein
MRPLLPVLSLLVIPAAALANTPDDVFGVTPRTIAMGGAGTALAGDHGAVHYNPAALTGCPSSQVALDVSRISHHLSFTDENAAAPEPLVPRRVRDQTRFTFGTCLALPLDLRFGFMLNLGIPGAISLDQQTANKTPSFVMYGEANEQVSIALGLGWKVTPTLSFGAGLAVLFATNLPLTADFPILEPDPGEPSGYRPVAFGLGVSMDAVVAPRLGLLWSPTPKLNLGVAYRGPVYHDLDVDAQIIAKLIVEIPVPVHVDSLGWFSPRQLSAGFSAEPADGLTIAADVTYYRWGELRTQESSYPFLNMYSLDPEGASGALVFPRPINSGWKNNLAYRAGLEKTTGSIALRGGFGYRTAAVNNAEDSNVNLLDAPVVTASAGFTWKTGDTAKSKIPRTWWRYTLPDVRFQADLFVRIDHLIEQRVDHDASTPTAEVPTKHYAFGGNVLQFGAQATLGW